MTVLATARATTTVAPQEFFETWADVGTWPEWNSDIDWVTRDAAFEQGATGKLKPTGGPTVRYTIETLTADRFTDVSKLIGARLTFDHRLTTSGDLTTVEVEISIDGPLRAVWNRIMGGGVVRAAQPDLDSLVATVEKRARP